MHVFSGVVLGFSLLSTLQNVLEIDVPVGQPETAASATKEIFVHLDDIGSPASEPTGMSAHHS